MPQINYDYFVSVKFRNAPRAYYFGTNDTNIKNGTKVVVETVRGKEVGVISSNLTSIDKYSSEFDLSPILRIATETDLKWEEQNIKDAEVAFKIFNEESKNLSLDMRLIYAEYTLDKSKIIFSYLADNRIDFRELLKVLASKLRTRIELRQIGPRDKAKVIGGLGICGLPICCSTFLNEFDGISINLAKNQMLAINIPKLSGHCGRLICCLKFEDEAYTDLKKQFPPLGDKINMETREWKVTSYNVISKTIYLTSTEEDIEDRESRAISLEDFNKIKHPFVEKKPFDKNKNFKGKKHFHGNNKK